MAKSNKWTVRREPEMVPVPTDQRRYDQLLDIIAEILYESSCQLEKLTTDSSSSETHVLFDGLNQTERTGTDG